MFLARNPPAVLPDVSARSTVRINISRVGAGSIIRILAASGKLLRPATATEKAFAWEPSIPRSFPTSFPPIGKVARGCQCSGIKPRSPSPFLYISSLSPRYSRKLSSPPLEERKSIRAQPRVMNQKNGDQRDLLIRIRYDQPKYTLLRVGFLRR